MDDKSPDVDDAVRAARRSHALLRYSTLRAAIFLLTLALLWLCRVRGALLVLLALLASGLASYPMLVRQRDEASEQLLEWRERRARRSSQRAAREDDLQDDLRRCGQDVEEDVDSPVIDLEH